MKSQKVFGFVVVVLIFSSMFVGLIHFPAVVRASDENWLSGWGYRKSLVVGSGVHVVTVHYGSGSDVLGHVYMDGKCQEDFDDIRFTGSDGKSLIAGVTVLKRIVGDYAEFKVDVASSPIYVYYGNVSVSGIYGNELFGSGSLNDIEDMDELTEHYIVNATSGQITGMARASPVTGFVLSLEAAINSHAGRSASMARPPLSECPLGIYPHSPCYGKRIVSVTVKKKIPAAD